MSESEVKTNFEITFVKQNVETIKNIIKNMKKNNEFDPVKYEMKILEELPEFYQAHPFLVKKICKNDDLSMLYKMFDQLEQVQAGEKTLSNVEHNLGSELAKKYLSNVNNDK